MRENAEYKGQIPPDQKWRSNELTRQYFNENLSRHQGQVNSEKTKVVHNDKSIVLENVILTTGSSEICRDELNVLKKMIQVANTNLLKIRQCVVAV